MIKYHQDKRNLIIAEIPKDHSMISSPGDFLDLIADVGNHNCSRIMIHASILHRDFFDLRTGLAGEMLQKCSNYRIRLAIVGNFSVLESKSLRDFILESNKQGLVSFVSSTQEAINRLS
jgi:hypothetical protein